MNRRNFITATLGALSLGGLVYAVTSQAKEQYAWVSGYTDLDFERVHYTVLLLKLPDGTYVRNSAHTWDPAAHTEQAMVTAEKNLLRTWAMDRHGIVVGD